MLISVVIPVYNSEKTIGALLEEIQQEFICLEIDDYEIILVNDGSRDNALLVIKSAASTDPRIKIIDLARNFGQGNASFTGYQYASGEYIIKMDDDLQHPGYEIGKLIYSLEKEEYDVVFARYQKQEQSRFRLIGTYIHSKMLEIIIGKPKHIHTNSFFIMRRFVKDEVIKHNTNYPYLFGILFATTDRIGNVYTDHRRRTNGKSNYNLHKLLKAWLNGFFGYSIKPLRAATVMGFVSAFISMIYAIYIISRKLIYPAAATGWASIIVAIIFFSSVQLIGIGVLGEYIGRLYISFSRLPKAVIREVINIDDESQIH